MLFFAVLHGVLALGVVDGSSREEKIPATLGAPLYASRASPRGVQLTTETVTATASPAFPAVYWAPHLGVQGLARQPRIVPSIQSKCHTSARLPHTDASPHCAVSLSGPWVFTVFEPRCPIRHIARPMACFLPREWHLLSMSTTRNNGHDPAWQLCPDKCTLVGPGAPSSSIAGLIRACYPQVSFSRPCASHA
ncbi:hypothetical protein L226DRAFT_69231 [Lentinus tigrinus ALCF2SS1-7]|uniref:uncharacterized protein n=1 Tax=Lentinus tigrinus ALCF2SS1-7 TaxID=1328758 RepID=UPI0011662586|nr:hypothetical protein L226DRAFT_69231 [Lentinus tigrinus ALCF2SS1-7]